MNALAEAEPENMSGIFWFSLNQNMNVYVYISWIK